MTVSSTESRKTYAGDGTTTSFDTNPVAFFDDEDLTLYIVTTATGALVDTLVLNTDYTVSGGDGGLGTVDLSAGSAPYGAPPVGTTLVMVRSLEIVQESDFVQNDGSDAEVNEDALDRLTMICQELSERVARTAIFADSDVSGATLELPALAVRINKVLAFDSSGNMTVSTLTLEEIEEQAAIAEGHADDAAASAGAAAASATSAASSVTDAAAQVTLAEAQVALATTAVTDAQTAQTAAEAAQAAAEAASELAHHLLIACSDESTPITAGTAKVTFRMPYAMTLTGIRGSLNNAETGGTLTVDVNASGTTILSTKLTFDAGEKTTTTAATPAVISDTGLADDEEITIDVDAISDGVAYGLKITLLGVPA